MVSNICIRLYDWHNNQYSLLDQYTEHSQTFNPYGVHATYLLFNSWRCFRLVRFRYFIKIMINYIPLQ